jgi:hypothetical protein
MAGLIEAGGRTRGHVIKPKKTGTLVFDGRAGIVFWKGPLQHPGGTVKKSPELQKAMGKVVDRMVPILDGTYAQLSRLLL